MKKVGLIILALVVMVGFGVRSSYAGVICIDDVSSCNDFKLFISPDTGGGIKEVHGYEYGCGYDDRGVSGSMKMTPTSKHFTLTGSYINGSQLGIFYINIDKATNTGTGGWSYNNGTYWSGTSSYSIVPCPKVGAGAGLFEADEITEPDTANP
jgi:hypothetical protein